MVASWFERGVPSAAPRIIDSRGLSGFATYGSWLVEELAHELHTSKPTIYRHIKKLKSMDLLEEAYLDTEAGTQRKGYKLRYGSLGDAWHFAEEHVTVAMANYRKTIDHIQTLAEKKRK